jgi:hypothetical protein
VALEGHGVGEGARLVQRGLVVLVRLALRRGPRVVREMRGQRHARLENLPAAALTAREKETERKRQTETETDRDRQR